MYKEINNLQLRNMTYRGCAEQEILQQELFFNCLKKINKSSPLMVELGCCDAFYSILFNKFLANQNPLNYCIEINQEFLNIGVNNVKNNECKNFNFIHAGVGTLNETSFHVACKEISTVEKLNFKDFLEKYSINYVDILHMDIQGTEMSVLKEIVDNQLHDKIRFVFISTHNADGIFGPSHEYCLEVLKDVNKTIYFENKHEGGVGDGLIVLEFLQ